MYVCMLVPNLSVLIVAFRVTYHSRTTKVSGVFTTTDEFYFSTSEKTILENCRCIVPNFMNGVVIVACVSKSSDYI
jgi:hypothetical protein